MKNLAIVLLFHASSLCAQHFGETIALATDKINYRYADTVYVSGLLLSPDAVQPSSLSKYCTVELINAKGEIVKRQKVHCEDAVFHSRIPLNETGSSDYFIVRAYTQFMRNFNDSLWPMTVIGLNDPLRHPILNNEKGDNRGSLQLAYTKNHIVYQYIPVDPAKAEGTLSIYAAGKKIGETSLHKENSKGIIAADSLPETMLYGLVADGENKIMAGRGIAINTEPSQPFTVEADSTVKANALFDITLKGEGENVCLMMRLEKAENPPQYLIRQGADFFKNMDATLCRQLLTGQYPYSFPPEQVLSIKGKVKTEQRNTHRKGGTIIAFNTDTGLTYDGDIAEDGAFEIGVDDFKEEDTFFLQAYNNKGKSYNYQIELPDVTYPGLHLPPVQWKENNSPEEYLAMNRLDTGRIYRIPEVTVEAFIFKEDVPSNRFYKKNYVDREEIVKGNLVTMEALLRRIVGITLRQTESGQYIIKPTRGYHSFLGDDQPVGINIDGTWFNNSGEDVDIQTIIDPADIATIEFLPAVAALKYGVKAYNGVLVITTRSGKDKQEIPSQGIHYQPAGLYDNRPFSEEIPLTSCYLRAGEIKKVQWRAPSGAGSYRIVMEAIGEKHSIYYRKQGLVVEM